MGLQGWPRGVIARQFFFTECGVDFSVTDTMHGEFLTSALAFGQQMVLVHTRAQNQRSATQRAVAQGRGLGRYGLSTSQTSLAYHGI